MNDAFLRPGERLDDLLIDNIKIIQSEAGFRFSIDAVLLTHFATVRQGVAAVDLGAGTGVIGLLLTTRGASRVTGVEINEQMVEMANRTIQLNKLGDRLEVMQGDLRQLPKLLPGACWQLVVANPPYRPVGQGCLNPNDAVAIARHEITATLQDVIAAARYLLQYRGRFAMVHLPERMVAILQGMSMAGIEPKRLRLVYPSQGKKPVLVLVEGMRGASAGLNVLPPLYIYNEDGGYSNEIMKYYTGGR